MDIEKKIWLPASAEDPDARFRKELTNLVQAHGIGAFVCGYTKFTEPKVGKLIVLGQPSSRWLDGIWQRIRLHASDLITSGKVR